VARELQHTFDIDWYLERDKHSSSQLAAVAEAAISASSSIGSVVVVCGEYARGGAATNRAAAHQALARGDVV
jgi:hypothetical protein